MKFIGIADCHGLESFFPARKFNLETQSFDENNEVIGFMVLRANANAHRRALVFRVELGKEEGLEVMEMFEDGEYLEALNLLKQYATKVEVAGGQGMNRQKAWDSIPNPDLDPYH
jgi:hypothetical protein